MVYRAALAAVLVVALPALAALAGPLDPPGGPISSTAKSLAEVEPRTAISIATTPGDLDSLYRISASGSYYLIANIDGVAGNHGIEIAASNVTIDLCGFTMKGTAGVLRGITNDGFQRDIIVKNGILNDWDGGGVVLNQSRNCTVTDITVYAGGGAGIEASVSSIIRNCTIDGGGPGAGPTVAGIQGDTSVLIESCRVSFCRGDGVSVNHECTVRDCLIRTVAFMGVRGVDSSNLIEGCAISIASQHGVLLGNTSVVRHCSVYSCTGSGILVSNTDNRIESNSLIGCNRGLNITAPGNIAIRNSATGNAVNFDVVAGNFGQYAAAAAGGAFAGNAGGLPLGAADPSANYSY